MKKKYCLKNKRRFYTFLAIVAFSLVLALSGKVAYGDKQHSYKTINIKSGDTLWSIAEKYNNKGDIRKYIYIMKKINDLNNSNICIGSTIKIPEAE